jgi:hypothetical protein
MAQMNIALDSNAASISTFAGIDPSWTGVYFHAIVDGLGTVASNNFLSVLNPVGSGKLAIALGFICSSYSLNSITLPASLTAFRTSSHSGGTLQSAATINRFATAFPDPVAQVRFGNPTTVNTNATNPMLGIPPVVGTGANNGETVAPTPGASFAFLPGEGIVFNTPTGDVDQRWCIQYIWAEKSL